MCVRERERERVNSFFKKIIVMNNTLNRVTIHMLLLCNGLLSFELDMGWFLVDLLNIAYGEPNVRCVHGLLYYFKKEKKTLTHHKL